MFTFDLQCGPLAESEPQWFCLTPTFTNTCPKRAESLFPQLSYFDLEILKCSHQLVSPGTIFSPMYLTWEQNDLSLISNEWKHTQRNKKAS